MSSFEDWLSSSFVDISINCSILGWDHLRLGSQFVRAQNDSTPSRKYPSVEYLQIFGPGLHEKPLAVDSDDLTVYTGSRSTEELVYLKRSERRAKWHFGSGHVGHRFTSVYRKT
ncbi:hypothetical protein TNCV_303221 [Trichonephila clavipes]|nr:hypothetical protein TNCV_303221 [Trichonephila clavipes]